MDIASIAAEQTSHAEIVRYVFDKLLAQGVPSAHNDTGACLYRAPYTPRSASPIRCGIGHLIADDHYSDAIEDERAIDALNRAYGEAWIEANMPDDTLELFAFLQSVHDHIGCCGGAITIGSLRNSAEYYSADADTAWAKELALATLAAIEAQVPA